MWTVLESIELNSGLAFNLLFWLWLAGETSTYPEVPTTRAVTNRTGCNERGETWEFSHRLQRHCCFETSHFMNASLK